MNIWAMEKDITIKHLLLLLSQSFGEKTFLISIGQEFEQENEKSIRLMKSDESSLSVYIYTYGQEKDEYGVHLEYPNLKETSVNDTLDIYERIGYQGLCDLLQTHLDVYPLAEN